MDHSFVKWDSMRRWPCKETWFIWMVGSCLSCWYRQIHDKNFMRSQIWLIDSTSIRPQGWLFSYLGCSLVDLWRFYVKGKSFCYFDLVCLVSSHGDTKYGRDANIRGSPGTLFPHPFLQVSRKELGSDGCIPDLARLCASSWLQSNLLSDNSE